MIHVTHSVIFQNNQLPPLLNRANKTKTLPYFIFRMSAKPSTRGQCISRRMRDCARTRFSVYIHMFQKIVGHGYLPKSFSVVIIRWCMLATQTGHALLPWTARTGMVAKELSVSEGAPRMVFELSWRKLKICHNLPKLASKGYFLEPAVPTVAQYSWKDCRPNSQLEFQFACTELARKTLLRKRRSDF